MKEDIFRDVLDKLIEREREAAFPFSPEFCMKKNCYASFELAARDIKEALDALDLSQEEVLLLREFVSEKQEDGNKHREREANITLYSSYQALKKGLIQTCSKRATYEKDHISQCALQETEHLRWYELEKYEPADVYEMGNSFSYIMSDSDPTYFVRRYPYSDECQHSPLWLPGAWRYFFPRRPSIPLPFAPGDILEVDRLPFAPLHYACVVYIDRFFQEGEPTILFLNNEGCWECRWIRTNTSVDSSGCLSAIYQTRTVKDLSVLSESDQILREVQAFVEGNEVKGKLLAYEMINKALSDNELREAMNLVAERVARGDVPEEDDYS